MDHSFSKPFLVGLLTIVVDLSMANYQHGLGPLKLTSRDMSFLKSIPQILSELSHDASHAKKKIANSIVDTNFIFPNCVG
jgi:hypothetical protein